MVTIWSTPHLRYGVLHLALIQDLVEYSIDSIWSTPCGINIQIYGVLQENIDEGDHSILYFLCDSWSTPYGHYMEYSIWSSYGVLHMVLILCIVEFLIFFFNNINRFTFHCNKAAKVLVGLSNQCSTSWMWEPMYAWFENFDARFLPDVLRKPFKSFQNIQEENFSFLLRHRS